MPKFENLRVSLAREETPPLVEAAGHPERHMTRTEFLQRAFASPLRFISKRGAVLSFHPVVAPSGYAAGFFSKPSPMMLNDEDLTPYLASNHEPALFLISLDKSQTVWMQQNARVGSPKAVLEAFFEHLLTKTDLKDWRAYVRYFETHLDYWDVVRTRKNEITKIVFRYVPPNAFEGRKLAQEYHSAVAGEARSQSVEEIFRGPPGTMDPEGDMMRANAEIAEQGAGERELRGIGNRLLYSSAQGRRVESVPDGEMPTVDSPEFVRRVINWLFGP